MGRLLDQVGTVAATDFPVLITGESGTGKEMVARYIHQRSSRAKGPFIAGQLRGRPLGAVRERVLRARARLVYGRARGPQGPVRGRREGLDLPRRARRGDAENQVKLLRVLQENEVKRVGEQTPRKVDARLICATNRDLRAAVRAGQFREDLYYRINVFP
jgi:two-component system response regulator FlrC